MKRQPFYHITAVDNVEKIMKEGLKGGMTPRNRDEQLTVPSVFVLTTKREDENNLVAVQQIWPCQDVEEYAVLQIDLAGIKGPVLPDQCAELLAPVQRIIQQAVIEPKYLKLVKTRRINYPGGKLLAIGLAFRKRKLTPQEWTLARKYMFKEWIKWQEEFEALNKSNTPS